MSTTHKKLDFMSRRPTGPMMAAIALAIALVTGGFIWFTVSAHEQAFTNKINSTLVQLGNALSMPLWTIDKTSVNQLGEKMLQGDLVVGIDVRDEKGKPVYSSNKDTSQKTILLTIPVYHKKTLVGELAMRFSRAPLHSVIQRDLTLIAGGWIALLLFGYWNWRLRSEVRQRKRIEEELVRSKEAAESANRAKSAFLANMSHELRTPLNAILGFSRMMQNTPAIPETEREKLDIINRSGTHLLQLINDVLDMSKIEAGLIRMTRQAFDLHRTLKVIEEIVRSRAEAKGLRFRFHHTPDIPRYIRTDEGKLRQVLVNLLDNAFKFTSQGSVALRVRCQSSVVSGKSQRTTDNGQLTLKFEVEDTGNGIAPEAMGSIFDPFVQKTADSDSEKGTGLGLAISRKYVQLMGGNITVKSEVGEGSVFRFEIQVEPADLAEIETEKPARRVIGLEPDQPAHRILVVEDNMENRMSLKKLLQSVGLEVLEALNGKEAVEIHAKWQPHLIWMDMRMPVMDGYEATRRIRELGTRNRYCCPDRACL